MKNKKKTIMLIMIITISMILLTWNKSYSYKMNDIIPEEQEVERKEFGIYLQESGEKYTETDKFPDTGYLLNTVKTECREYGSDNVIPQAVTQSLTNGVIDGSIIVTSQKSMYCKIYFDKDETPIVSSFNITGKTSSGATLSNGYTYDYNVTYTFTWTDTDVAQYCLSDNNNSCINWQVIDENQKTSKTITIENNTYTNTEGPKTIYVYVKDKANNVSTAKTTNITVDRTIPVVNTLTLTGTQAAGMTLQSGYTHTTTVNYTSTITETNMEGYCIVDGSSCSNYNTSTTKSLNSTIAIGATQGSHPITISVKDKAGNIGSKSATIKYDSANPTGVTITNGTITETSIQITIGGTDSYPGGSVTKQCKANTGGWFSADANGVCTMSSLKAGTAYTIYVRVTDASGRYTEASTQISTAQAWTCPSGSVLTSSDLGSATVGYVCVKNGVQGSSYECNCQYQCVDKGYHYWTGSFDGDDKVGNFSSRRECEAAYAENECHVSECQKVGKGAYADTYYYDYIDSERYCGTCYHYACDDGWLVYTGSTDDPNLKCYKAPTKG